MVSLRFWNHWHKSSTPHQFSSSRERYVGPSTSCMLVCFTAAWLCLHYASFWELAFDKISFLLNGKFENLAHSDCQKAIPIPDYKCMPSLAMENIRACSSKRVRRFIGCVNKAKLTSNLQQLASKWTSQRRLDNKPYQPSSPTVLTNRIINNYPHYYHQPPSHLADCHPQTRSRSVVFAGCFCWWAYCRAS